MNIEDTRILRIGHGPVRPQRPMGPVGSVSMKLHVKCPVFTTKDIEDITSHLWHSNNLMNSKGIAENAKCGRFYLTLGGDGHFWYRSKSLLGTDYENL